MLAVCNATYVTLVILTCFMPLMYWRLETYPDVVPVHDDVVVSVGSVVLVSEPEDVEQLVDHDPLVDAAALVEPHLHPSHAGPVR